MLTHLEDVLSYVSAFLPRGVDVYEAVHSPENYRHLPLLLSTLRETPSLALFDGQYQEFWCSKRQVQLEDLAAWMILRMRSTTSVDVCDDLERYIESTNFPVFVITLLTGISVDQTYDFGDIKLMPPEMIPHDQLRQAAFHNNFSMLPMPEFSAALVKEIQLEKIHSVDCELCVQPEAFDNYIESMEDVRLCLSLSKESARGAQAIATGLIPPEYVPIFAGTSWSLHPFTSAKLSTSLSNGEYELASSAFHSFVSLDDNRQKHLRVPLKKLNSYATTQDPVESAINLRTALEALFLDKEAKQELSHRLATRAALLVGDNYESRKEIYNVVKKAYNMGSMAVHEGRVKGNPREVLGRAASITVQGINILLREPSVDWQKLELTGQR
ncbi:hypothetical protein [Neptuniibacter sp. QD34_54]|uniref:hypothetical protein n=1 Tax=Neptuniibacter sp. QD34_54 TaxID=3398208 RepID=UPI0039F558C6